MATFTKTNGTLQPVFATDTADGAIAGATSLAGQTVNLQGPKLDFFTLTANVTANTSGNTGGYLESVFNAVQQLGTIAMYQVDGTNISLGVYPAGAYTTATLLAAANVTATGIQLDSCQDVGFKLADS
jgi:hypothetical protein